MSLEQKEQDLIELRSDLDETIESLISTAKKEKDDELVLRLEKTKSTIQKKRLFKIRNSHPTRKINRTNLQKTGIYRFEWIQ